MGWCFGSPWCPSAPWAGWAPVSQLLVPGVPCWPQSRNGKPHMMMEQNLRPCCCAWCPELGHGRRGGTRGRSSVSAARPAVALPRCCCPGSFSGVQGSASMLGCCPAGGVPRRAGGAQGMFPPAPHSLHDICWCADGACSPALPYCTAGIPQPAISISEMSWRLGKFPTAGQIIRDNGHKSNQNWFRPKGNLPLL